MYCPKLNRELTASRKSVRVPSSKLGVALTHRKSANPTSLSETFAQPRHFSHRNTEHIGLFSDRTNLKLNATLVISHRNLMEDPVKDPMAHVWVIVVTGEDEDIHMVEAHVSKESADAAAKVLTMDEYYDLEIKMLELKSIVEIESSPKASSNSKKVKQAKKADTESEEDEGSASNEEGTTKEKRASRQKLPDVTDAIPNVLNGLTIIFTGISM